jgi:hypothetical protein
MVVTSHERSTNRVEILRKGVGDLIKLGSFPIKCFGIVMG